MPLELRPVNQSLCAVILNPFQDCRAFHSHQQQQCLLTRAEVCFGFLVSKTTQGHNKRDQKVTSNLSVTIILGEYLNIVKCCSLVLIRAVHLNTVHALFSITLLAHKPQHVNAIPQIHALLIGSMGAVISKVTRSREHLDSPGQLRGDTFSASPAGRMDESFYKANRIKSSPE